MFVIFARSLCSYSGALTNNSADKQRKSDDNHILSQMKHAVKITLQIFANIITVFKLIVKRKQNSKHPVT